MYIQCNIWRNKNERAKPLKSILETSIYISNKAISYGNLRPRSTQLTISSGRCILYSLLEGLPFSIAQRLENNKRLKLILFAMWSEQ